MCRNIKTLFNYDPPVTEEEIIASSLQYVRKISGYRDPSRANAEAFNRAVAEVSQATRKLLASLVTSAAPRDREEEVRIAKNRYLSRNAGQSK